MMIIDIILSLIMILLHLYIINSLSFNFFIFYFSSFYFLWKFFCLPIIIMKRIFCLIRFKKMAKKNWTNKNEYKKNFVETLTKSQTPNNQLGRLGVSNHPKCKPAP